MKNISSGSSSIQDDYKQFLLVKLTNAAQNLQYEKDNEILQAEFCRRVEMLMFYGVKSRPFKWRSESQDVWDLLKTISPTHITEDILQLTNVKTDTGRIRAWIRITINECSLQSFIPLLADQTINKKFYDIWAVFNDPDMVSRAIEQISSISGNNVVFNSESFDFEVAPSAVDLCQRSSFDSSQISPSSIPEACTVESNTTSDSSSVMSGKSSESNLTSPAVVSASSRIKSNNTSITSSIESYSSDKLKSDNDFDESVAGFHNAPRISCRTESCDDFPDPCREELLKSDSTSPDQLESQSDNSKIVSIEQIVPAPTPSLTHSNSDDKSLTPDPRILTDHSDQNSRIISNTDVQISDKSIDPLINCKSEFEDGILLDTESFNLDTENVILDTKNVIVDTRNVIVDTENVIVDTDNVIVDTENVIVETENVVQDTAIVVQDTGNVVQDTENVILDTENVVQNTDIIVEDTENFNPDTILPSLCNALSKDAISQKGFTSESPISETVPFDSPVLPDPLPQTTSIERITNIIVTTTEKQDLALQLLDSVEQINLSSSCLQLREEEEVYPVSPPLHADTAAVLQAPTDELAVLARSDFAACIQVTSVIQESHDIANPSSFSGMPSYPSSNETAKQDLTEELTAATVQASSIVQDGRESVQATSIFQDGRESVQATSIIVQDGRESFEATSIVQDGRESHDPFSFSGTHPSSNDILPSRLKDVLVEDEEICALRQKLGNSLQTSHESGLEMLAHRLEADFDDPYDEVSSAKSLTSSFHSGDKSLTSSHSGDSNSRDNLLQLIEADSPEEKKEVGSIPVPETRDYEQPQALSLGSSLYRLFIRGSSSVDPKSEHLSNLAALHSAVTDELPISQEEDVSTRSYLMGATRATVAYTYESANQWLSHSKDMWWWLQKRVIPEHDCQHPTPPTSDTMRSGSPYSSSLLDFCTEQCPCCNAVVIDYCYKDLQDPNSIPISKSCPPFSSITQHMQSPISQVEMRTKSVSNSKDYFNIDILQNPAPSVASLDEAIEVQKSRTQNTLTEDEQKKEMDVLVQLRKKKNDLQSSDSSSSEDSSINILGHSLVKSSELGGYCGKCGGAIYRRIKTSFSCSACSVLFHKGCLNDVVRRCTLANKEDLLLETRLTPAHGLHEQNYCCFDCSAEISYTGSKVNMCDYSGRYYCSDCHKKALHLVPARVLHNWDFKPRPVALQSHEVICYLTNKQYLNIEQLNPDLFNFVAVLGDIRELREKIILYKALFVQCSKAIRDGMFLKLKARQHFVDSSKLYTLHDLVEAHSGSLVGELQGVVSDYQSHRENCQTCSNQKFVCAVCHSPPAIRPFSDFFNIAQCFTCHGVLHRECFNKSSCCPYCAASLICET